MANEEHVNILKKGVETWNQWRNENPRVPPNLSEANLRGRDLSEVDFRGTSLARADLSNAILARVDFSGADLSEANLRNADLTEADLTRATLNRVCLEGANCHQVVMLRTILAEVDLSQVQGLASTHHRGPSTLGIDTIYRSQGMIPKVFLQGVGIPASFLTYMSSVVNQPIDYYTIFISYSHQDQLFATQLHADLQDRGVRCWFAPEDMKIGDKIRSRIDDAIHLHDKLLLMLSEHSIASNWVADEVEAAIEKEQRQKREMLFPVRLDDTVMQTTQAWAATLRRTRHIGDFTNWPDPQAYQIAFDRLLRDLKKADEQ